MRAPALIAALAACGGTTPSATMPNGRHDAPIATDGGSRSTTTTVRPPDDPNLWLEEVTGDGPSRQLYRRLAARRLWRAMEKISLTAVIATVGLIFERPASRSRK